MSIKAFKKKFLPILLVTATVFSLLYASKKNNAYNAINSKLKQSIEEKQALQEKLDKTTANFKKTTAKNKKLSRRVISEINKIITLKDSVNDLDDNLRKDKKAFNNERRKKTSLTKKLSNKITDLANTVNKAKLLKASAIEVFNMKKRNNGKFIKTTNTNKIDAFKVNFQVLKNEIATPGKKRISLQILDPANKLVISKNSAANKYSDELTIDYNNESLDVISLIEVERKKIKLGEYKIKAFIEGRSISEKTFSLR